MRNIFISLIILLPSWICVSAQESYFQRPDLLSKVEQCLQFTYNFSFQEARKLQREIAEETPGHPAPPFLEALIVYWENFPLTPDNRASEHFLELMDNSVKFAGNYLDDVDTNLEGIFFDLFGRAFKAMFWADNGRASKLLPDLAPMYRQTKEGFDLKDQFPEFYFSTGLYNYYVEAYPEAHPVYKPLLAFMRGGDKKLGLEQLNYAIDHTVYLKVESILFMSLIQLKYEEDLKTAALFAERLNRDYPNNIYYQGHLITILLYLDRFRQAEQVLESMKNQHDSYSEMITTMAGAFIAEKVDGDSRRASTEYTKTVDLANSFGPIAESYVAIGLMGLSRIHKSNGKDKEAQEYERQASRYTHYKFILDQ